MRLFAAISIALLLAGCAGGRPQISEKRINRALALAPGEAQPSKIVATELAFARMARNEGQWTAFRAFAAPEAVIHLPGGTVMAQKYLARLDDPAEAVRWNPRAVWVSCDGISAISKGRYRQADGEVGNYLTVWKRQDDQQYKWVYDMGVADNPQPPPRPTNAPAGKDEIVVSAYDAVEGFVSDCPGKGANRGKVMPVAPAQILTDGFMGTAGTSADGTLQWRWEHGEDNTRRFIAEFFHESEWQVALDETYPSSLGK